MTHTFHKRQNERFDRTFRHFFIILLTVLLTRCFRRDTDLLRYNVTMRVLGGNERTLHEKTGLQTERNSVQQRCSVRIIYCHNCSNFSTIIQSDLIYSFVKQQNVKLKVKRKMCHTEILGFFPPAQPENRKHSTKKLGTGLHCPRAGPFRNNPIGADTKNVPCAYQQFLVD